MTPSRQAVLDGILSHFPHEDQPSLEGQTGRYAIVQRHERVAGAFWYDLVDDAEQGLVACANDYVESKYIPFLVVDLDTGLATEVELAFRFGDPSTKDFSGYLTHTLDRSPRGRTSGLAEDIPDRPDMTARLDATIT